MSARMIDVDGDVESRFDEVRNVFVQNFVDGTEVGASLCVYHNGRPVVDLWGGLADQDGRKAWDRDTLTVVFSSTKGLTASVVTLLLDRGILDLDAPVAQYWPEFAAEGKGSIPLRWLFAHKAGLAALDGPISIDEVESGLVYERLASARPLWDPGTANGYHGWTAGWLISEVIRRTTGRTVGRYFADEIAQPLGLDCFIGLPPADEDRVSTLAPRESREEPDPIFNEMLAALGDPTTLTYRALTALAMDSLHAMNTKRFHQAEIPSGGGITNARSLAKLYAALAGEVDGVRLVRPQIIDVARRTEASGRDLVTLCEMRWGPTHFMLPGGPMRPDFGVPIFGHGGAGGSLGFADPENGIAFGYAMNRMLGLVDSRNRVDPMVEAVYRCIT